MALVSQRKMKFPGRRNIWRRRQRKGVAVIEFAIIAQVVFLLLIGFAVLAMGVYRYQQVAYLAREGARYASTHGAQYRADNHLPVGDSAVWTQDIRDNGILVQASAFNPSRLACTANWSAGDNRANAADSTNGFTSIIKNSVTVTVTYEWFPEAYLTGPINLSSTATTPMAY